MYGFGFGGFACRVCGYSALRLVGLAGLMFVGLEAFLYFEVWSLRVGPAYFCRKYIYHGFPLYFPSRFPLT